MFDLPDKVSQLLQGFILPSRRKTPRVHSGLANVGPVELIEALYRYARHMAQKKVLSLTLEVTRRCNAQCDFCDHWREPKQAEEVDYADVIKKLDPLVVVFCGGEPLLRRDILDIVRTVTAVPGWRYHTLITNGWLLDREKGLQLNRAGVHQINVSLNWPDQRQDEERKIKGLFDRIKQTVPALAAEGLDINLNTVIMRDNIDEITKIARLANEWGAKISYTLYSEFCNGNKQHQFTAGDRQMLAEVIDELLLMKSDLRHITNSRYYLKECLNYISGKKFPRCQAGKRMVHLSPQGMIKPCADLPPIAHYRDFDYRAYAGVDCDVCWMACRGEVEAPVTFERAREIIGW